MDIDNQKVLKFSLEDFLLHTQLSEYELLKSFKKLNAIEVNGQWGLIAPTLKSKIIEALLASLDVLQITMEAVPEIEILQELINDGYYENQIRHILEEFSQPFTIGQEHAQSSSSKLQVFYKLSKIKLCGYYGSKLLCNMERQPKLSSFLHQWQNQMSLLNLIPQIEDMLGYAVIIQNGKQQHIVSLIEYDLPYSLQNRLQALFQTKTQWLRHDLKVYLQIFEDHNLDVNKILLKYCRSIQNTNGHEVQYILRSNV